MFELKVLKIAIYLLLLLLYVLLNGVNVYDGERQEGHTNTGQTQARTAILLATFSYRRPGSDPEYHFSTEGFGRGPGLFPPSKKPFCLLCIRNLEARQ